MAWRCAVKASLSAGNFITGCLLVFAGSVASDIKRSTVLVARTMVASVLARCAFKTFSAASLPPEAKKPADMPRSDCNWCTSWPNTATSVTTSALSSYSLFSVQKSHTLLTESKPKTNKRGSTNSRSLVRIFSV